MVITYYFISSLSVLSFWFLVKDFYHQDDPASYVSGASQVRIPAMCEQNVGCFLRCFQSTLLQNGWLKFVEHHDIYQQESLGFVFVLFSHVRTPPPY